METTTPAANGSAEAVVERPLDRIRREAEERLGELLAPLQARRAQLEAELRDLNAEQEEILAVAGALHAKAAKPPKAVKGSGKSATHTVSQKVQDDVYAVMAKSDLPDMTKDDVAAATGLSDSSVMGALRELRLAERIRLTGTRKREGDERAGGRAPSAYAVMPNG